MLVEQVALVADCERLAADSPLMTSPNSSQRSPLNRIICSCSIGAKSVGAGVDLDAGQQHVGREILQVRRLLHDVLAGEIVAALLQHLHQGLRRAVAVHDGAVELVAVRDSTCP